MTACQLLLDTAACDSNGSGTPTHSNYSDALWSLSILGYDWGLHVKGLI